MAKAIVRQQKHKLRAGMEEQSSQDVMDLWQFSRQKQALTWFISSPASNLKVVHQKSNLLVSIVSILIPATIAQYTWLVKMSSCLSETFYVLVKAIEKVQHSSLFNVCTPIYSEYSLQGSAVSPNLIASNEFVSAFLHMVSMQVACFSLRAS